MYSSISRLSLVRLAGLLALATFMMMSSVGQSMPAARASSDYNCDTLHGHCYGEVIWTGSTNGADTTITQYDDYGYMLPGTFQNGKTGIENQEMWWQAPYPSKSDYCAVNGYISECWIETGIHSAGVVCPGSNPCYFWADVRPCTNCSNGYFEHYVANLSVSDTNLHASIYGPGGSDGQTYTVYTGTGSANYYSFSTGNAMLANNPLDEIKVGAELGSYQGAQYPRADWTLNYWADSSGTWHLQTNNGQTGVSQGDYAGPIISGWATPPTQQAGGDWYAYCDNGTYYVC